MISEYFLDLVTQNIKSRPRGRLLVFTLSEIYGKIRVYFVPSMVMPTRNPA